MTELGGRACFRTRRGGWGERYAPNAAKPGAPAGVNVLTPLRQFHSEEKPDAALCLSYVN